MSKALSAVDFIVRLAYFFAAPLLLTALTLIFPITGALVNVALAVVFFVLAPALRPRIEKRKWLRLVLRRFLAFEAYYREAPPRPFVYYVFYPLLFPYWLIVKSARREFLLFRGFTLLTLGILVVSNGIQYFTKWRPELGLAPFLESVALLFLVEGVIVMAFVMPLATSVIGYHMAGKRKRLVALLLAIVAAACLGAIRLHSLRHDRVSVPAQIRMILRTEAAPDRARAAREEAIVAAWRHILENPKDATFAQDFRREVEVLGAPLDAAREKLAALYKDDEARLFFLVAVVEPKKAGRMLLLFAAPGSRHPVWVGLRAHLEGKTPVPDIFEDPAELPPGIFAVLQRVTQK